MMTPLERRDVSPILLQTDSPFFRLCYDVRAIIYEHMVLPPLSSGEEYHGFVLSCRLACVEAKEAAARALSKSFANDLRLVERRAADRRIRRSQMFPEHFTLLELPPIPSAVSFEQLRNMTFSLEFSHQIVTHRDLKHFSLTTHLVDDLSAIATPNFRRVTLIIRRELRDDPDPDVADCDLFIRNMELAVLRFATNIKTKYVIPERRESGFWGGSSQDSINTDRVVLAWDFRTAHGTREDVQLRGWRYTAAHPGCPRMTSSITASQQMGLKIGDKSTYHLPDSVCDPDIPQYYYVHTSDRMVGEVGIMDLYRWRLSELLELYFRLEFYNGTKPSRRARNCTSEGIGKPLVDDATGM